MPETSGSLYYNNTILNYTILYYTILYYNTITPELLNLPDWDLGPEHATQIDLLPNLPTSGGYQTVMTAIDVFSRYLFAYPLIEATATSVAKVIIDIMTKQSYLPTTLITTKGPHLHQPS